MIINKNKNSNIRKLLVLLLAAALGCMTLAACRGSAEKAADKSASGASALTEFPEFSTVDLEGNAVDNSLFAESDITVINFWGTYCPPCIREMPDLAKWSDEMPDNVRIIGIVIDVDSTDSEEYSKAVDIVSDAGVKYTNLLVCQDMAGIFKELVGVPTTYFVDSEGKILCEPITGAYVDEYKSTVEDLL